MTNKGRAQLTGASGEHFVVAELNKRGVHAVPFAGNIPDIDAIAVPSEGRTILIQVKTQRGAGWAISGKERSKEPNPAIVWALVKSLEGTQPQYWMVPDETMRALLQADYAKNPASFKKADFHKIGERALADWKDRWELLGCST